MVQGDCANHLAYYHGGALVNKVADSRTYRVLGVDALRVIDGSTFNFSLGTNLQATCMMLGRCLGVQILRERLQQPAAA
ncbi:unnamed protein product [Sphagnum tenellum]